LYTLVVSLNFLFLVSFASFIDWSIVRLCLYVQSHNNYIWLLLQYLSLLPRDCPGLFLHSLLQRALLLKGAVRVGGNVFLSQFCDVAQVVITHSTFSQI
jgi:hypothetical protein